MVIGILFAMEQDLYDYDEQEVIEDNDTYGEMRQFDNTVNEIEKTLSYLGEKGIRIVELGEYRKYSQTIYRRYK